MKYVDEYRTREAAQPILDAIAREATRSWAIMEVCGGQTHAIARYGLDALLPSNVELLHGPGCPVCVTPLEVIDRAHAIASRREVIFCSYGDMLRVPGSNGDLLERKSRGSDVRVVYSPMDAVKIAEANPTRQVVFLAVGFETTAPAAATAIRVARARGITNFSVLLSHVLVPPAMASILQAPGNRVQAFLGPGHVCTVMGTREYAPIAARYRVPIVVTGFEPVDLLAGVLAAVRQLEQGRAEVENAYSRVVHDDGNRSARDVVDEVFDVCDRPWRGIGVLPKSGLRLRGEYATFDAAARFDVEDVQTKEPADCISGQVLRGLLKPIDCPLFGTACTPEAPRGATMVSSEGACAAYYLHKRRAS